MTDSNIDLTSTAALAAAIDNPSPAEVSGNGETVAETPGLEAPVAPVEPAAETPVEPPAGEQAATPPAEEPALTPEEEAGIMLRADYTRKTQALAEQRKQLEAERAAFEAERAALLAGTVNAAAPVEAPAEEAAQNPTSAAEALTAFKFEPLQPFVVPDDADEDTIADFAAANRQVEAINKAGEFAAQSAPLLAQALEFNSRMYEYIQISEANAEFERTKAAMDEKYQGFDLTIEQFASAMIAELGDPKTVPPFFFEGWKNRTAEQRRNTIEKQFGPDILKRIKDKAQSDKAQPPTPPKTLDSQPIPTSQPPEQIDWTNTKEVQKYLDRLT